jgi:hypothetical protein
MCYLRFNNPQVVERNKSRRCAILIPCGAQDDTVDGVVSALVDAKHDKRQLHGSFSKLLETSMSHMMGRLYRD